jgi:uncharacterized protein DUF4386
MEAPMGHDASPCEAPARHEMAMIRWAGFLYLVILVAGLGAEIGLRGPLVTPGDAHATAAAILAQTEMYRAAIAADLIMAMADAGLAVLLFLIFRTALPGLALAAMVFRLIQTVLIAGNLMNLQTALILIVGGESQALAMLYIELHGLGYDLGLFFFGVNSTLTGWLIWKTRMFGRVFGAGIFFAGWVYLAGSGLNFFAPVYHAAFLPAYGLTILAETAFCLRLLFHREGARR